MRRRGATKSVRNACPLLAAAVCSRTLFGVLLCASVPAFRKLCWCDLILRLRTGGRTRAARRPCAAHRDNTARRRYRAACAHGRHENGRARVHVLTDATQ